MIRKAVMRGSEEGRWKSARKGNSLATYPTVKHGFEAKRRGRPRRLGNGSDTGQASQPTR